MRLHPPSTALAAMTAAMPRALVATTFMMFLPTSVCSPGDPDDGQLLIGSKRPVTRDIATNLVG
jgi:hypothetical protein